MNLNKFTEKAREAILGAQHVAETLSHAQIEPEHRRSRPFAAPSA
jgi:hypothetical protein